METLLTIAFSPEPALEPRALPTVARQIVPPVVTDAITVDLMVTLPPVDTRGHSEFRVNGVPFWKAKPFRSNLGETQVWVVNNDTQWDHPFHIHGYFFMRLDDQNQPLRPLAWKDTVNLPMKATTRLLVAFDERPGTWMFHCHILDHMEAGLMGTVHVGPGEPAHHTHHTVP